MIGDHSVGNFWSLVIAAARRRPLRVPRRDPADAALGPRRGHRHVRRARDHAEHPRQLGEDRPRAADALDRPADDRPLAGDGRRDRRRACVAFAYQLTPLGRKLRATREDPFAAQAAGIDVHRQRLWAFTLSGALAGFAGGLYVHLQSAINADIYLDFTFLTLAMLVVGGSRSLLGRGRRRARRSAASFSFLSDAENGSISWLHLRAGLELRRRRRVHGGRAALPAARADRRARVRYPPSSSPGRKIRSGTCENGTPPSAVTRHVSCM